VKAWRCAIAVALLPALVGSCDRETDRRAAQLTGGDPQRGRFAAARFGCGTCHTIPGVFGADAHVGPPLDQLARRIYLAGHLVNTPENLVSWIRSPQSIRPGSAMPEMGIGEQDGRDIAAYLYTLQ
jgi:cytochrome c2